MEKKSYFDRFKKFTVGDWIAIGFMTAIALFSLYMCISFSVKLGQGLTLFGDSAKYTNDTVETVGPTSADITVTVIYWIVTILVLLLDIFIVFIKKPTQKKVVKKDIVDGRTVIIKEDRDDKE